MGLGHVSRGGVRLPAVALVAVLAAGQWGAPLSASAAPSCAAFTAKVYDQLNPSTGAQDLTGGVIGYAYFQSRGFTTDRTETMSAAPVASSGLAGVHRLFRPATQDMFYSLDPTEIARAVRSYGYLDNGVSFYASRTSASCLSPVRSYWNSVKGIHRFTTSSGEGAALLRTGWRAEAVRFHLGRSMAGSVFTLGVIPDTQQEVMESRDTRMADRSRWLVAHRGPLATAFVTHTGDVVNWDTPDHVQYVRAQAAMAPLNGKIPYSMTIGNHDTNAVGPGGGAADPKRTKILVRETPSFNRYLNAGTAALQGRFEPGKVDNTYSTFSAGGAAWLVLNLEFLPRTAAVAWAGRVVAAHPRHNVIVVTHGYLGSNGTISTNPAYGQTSPQVLFDTLISRHSNIKMVLSGHAGTAIWRMDRGAAGNVIYTFQTAMHSPNTNPIRLLEINTRVGSVSAVMYAPHSRTAYGAGRMSPKALSIIRSRDIPEPRC